MNPGDVVGGFRINEKIGIGGMGTVYQALQLSVNRVVALKILHPHLAEDASLLARFDREAKEAAHLLHENIVQVFDSGRAGPVAFIAMELVEGQDLKHLTETSQPFPDEIVALILRDIAAGLEHAHARHVVHRDIKPANVKLTPAGRVKIMDFGLARRREDASDVTVVGTVLGTPAYMSPEQAEGNEVGVESDLFSLGVMGYELLAGRRPFAGDSYSAVLRAIVSEPVPPLEGPLPSHSAELVALVLRLLEKDPRLRMSATEAHETLESIVDSMGIRRGADLLRAFLSDPDACRNDLVAHGREEERRRAREQQASSLETVVHPRTVKEPQKPGTGDDSGDPNPPSLSVGPEPAILSGGREGREADGKGEAVSPGAPITAGSSRRAWHFVLAGAVLAVIIAIVIWVTRGQPPPPVPAPTGACCFGDGRCTVQTESACKELGGGYQGDGTTCSPNPCRSPETGACCLPDGTCFILSAEDCAEQHGEYQGGGTTCTSNPCRPPETGACCLPDGTCFILTARDCAQRQGKYQGGGTSCSPNPCPAPKPKEEVYVVSSKPYADIWVDGKPIQWAGTVALLPGRHRFHARKVNGETTDCSYDVKPGDPNGILVIDFASGTITAKVKD